MELLVDPSISRAKFAREIEKYEAIKDEMLKKGCWLLKADYPQVFLVMSAPQLFPLTVLLGITIDFTNYDFWPPSVVLVHPFTRIPYKNLAEPFLSFPVVTPSLLPGQLPPSLLQWHEGHTPFICLPGIREYHNHPGHSGDFWFLRRGKGEGTLNDIISKIYYHGIHQLAAIQIAGVRLIPQYNIQLPSNQAKQE